MRIVVATWSARLIGGIERYISLVIPPLLAEGHAVALLTETDDPADRDCVTSDARVTRWNASGSGKGDAISAARAWSPDVIYAHGLREPGFESALLDVAPAVFFAHGYFGTCISGAKTWTWPVVRPCHRRFGWPCFLHFYPHRCGGLSPLTMARGFRHQGARLRLLRRYAAIVTHSAHMRREYLQHAFEPDRVHSVPFLVRTNGASDAQVGPAWDQPIRLAFAGRMDRLKGGEVLLDAIAIARPILNRPITIAFAGDGPARADWESAAGRVTAGDPAIAVQFRGWLEDAALDSLLNESHLLVVPSLWPEPFGQVGPEAGLLGVPVAAFHVGGIPDWLKDGVNGFVAPGDPPTAHGLAAAIVRCLENRATYQRLRAGAPALAQHFAARVHVPRVVEILERAAARRSA